MKFIAFPVAALILLAAGPAAAADGLSIRKGGTPWAAVESDGGIRIGGTLAGRWEDDGWVRKDGTLVGRIEKDGTIRAGGTIIPSSSATCLRMIPTRCRRSPPSASFTSGTSA